MHQPRIAIVGAGFGGVGLACQLLAAGYHDVVLYERGEEIGGVWSANTYPGAACDVPSQLYSFSFAPNPHWSGNYPPQAEIRQYAEQVATDRGVLPLVRFGHTVRSARWVDGGWDLEIEPGGVRHHDWVFFAVGQLSHPALPDIAGRETFAGKAFHSAQWDHTVNLTGRRIGVIGTGASAIQFVPTLVQRASALTLFQRSAPYVLPKHEVRFDRGALRDVFGRIPALQHFSRTATYLSFESRALGFTVEPKLLGPWVKAHARVLAKAISDPDKRRALTPTEQMGCKRLLLSNDFYPAVADPKVRVETEKIVTITPVGVQTADGVEHELDVLIYGTGFAATRFLAGIEVYGAEGADLQAEWSAAGGAESFRGGTVAGFPNLSVVYGPNTNLGHNSIILMLEGQYRHLLGLLAAAGSGSVAPRPEAQQAWNRWVAERMLRTAFVAGCHSWYATAGGKHTNNWPSFTASYRLARRHGTRGLDPADYVFRDAPSASGALSRAVG